MAADPGRLRARVFFHLLPLCWVPSCVFPTRAPSGPGGAWWPSLCHAAHAAQQRLTQSETLAALPTRGRLGMNGNPAALRCLPSRPTAGPAPDRWHCLPEGPRVAFSCSPHALPNARTPRRQLALRHLWPPGLLLRVGDLLYLVEKCIRNFKLPRG